MSQLSKEIKQEIGKRRTFAIISHPDAGKTDLRDQLRRHRFPQNGRRGLPDERRHADESVMQCMYTLAAIMS